MPGERPPTGYRIGDVTLDVGRREIRRRGRVLPCGRLTFDLLALLAEHAPRVLSRDEVAARLWDGRYVSPATVKRRVALLRSTLGDRADDPAYVNVVRGQGFSLVAPVRPLRGRSAAWRWPEARYGVAAAVLLLAFVFGAEIGYQDGQQPRLPGLQGAASIFVTSWPDALPPDEHAFVMGAAQKFMRVVNETGFVGRFDDALAADDDAFAPDSLSVLANATTNDFESLHLTLALLSDSRPDYRPSRADALAAWSRALQDAPPRDRETIEQAESVGRDARAPGAADYRVYVMPPSRADEAHFMLVASFRFDRDAVRGMPQAIQSDAARYVALAIDGQTAPPGLVR